MGCKNWTTPVHVHIAIATEVIQLPHSWQQACFTIEVWLVMLTDESVLASNRKHIFVFCCGEGISLHCFVMHCYIMYNSHATPHL